MATVRDVIAEVNDLFYTTAQIEKRINALKVVAMPLLHETLAHLGKDDDYRAQAKAVQGKKYEWAAQSADETRKMLSEIRNAIEVLADRLDEHERERNAQRRRLGV